MTEVDTAIESRFDATSGAPAVHNALYIAISGKMYNEEAPEGIDIEKESYITFHELNAQPEYNFSSSFEVVSYQFNIFAFTITALDSFFTKLKDLYDNCTLTVSGYTSVYMKRKQSRRMPVENYWQRVVEYEVYLQKT